MKTQEELDQILVDLQAKYKPVFSISVPLNDELTEYATIFVRKPDKKILDAISKVLKDGDTEQAMKVFIKNTYLGGDDYNVFINDYDALMSCDKSVAKILERREAILKKN